MGTDISVQNKSGQDIMVQVWTKGRWFMVGDWGVGPDSKGHRKFQAVWYDLCVISGTSKYWIGIYGGNTGGTNLFFDGNILDYR